MQTNENYRQGMSGNDGARRVLIIGTGGQGQAIALEMQSNPQLRLLPVGFLADDEPESGRQTVGLPVLGGLRQLPSVIHSAKIEQIIIADPEATGRKLREIVGVCKKANLRVRILPGKFQPSGGGDNIRQLRDVRVEDLFRNGVVQTDGHGLKMMVSGKRVLVTGAGGSIGSELCRQIAQYEPARLALLGHGEHSIFTVSEEFARLRPALQIARVIADVRDADRIEKTFRDFRPQIVFHAAAHKHVSLMEENIEDAVSNNVLGTSNVVKAALGSGVESLILVSTDKAAKPTSMMGATKRVAELIVCRAAERSGCRYASVRFGNVLGSRGSVLSIFREQIERGGPLTLTHPEMRRYFMSIEEAVHPVLQAMLLAKGGEVFVLDMGVPLKIADLARELIEFSGLQLGRDIEIEFTGLRPGEKLLEEILLQSENYERTVDPKIFVALSGSGQCSKSYEGGDRADHFDKRVDALVKAAGASDRRLIFQRLKELVPEYEVENVLTLPACGRPQSVPREEVK
jgi:FlaA1/EpsC-like NDP-sugar epimerase